MKIEKTKFKYKVGDFVRVSNTRAYPETLNKIGVIIDIDYFPYPYRIRFINFKTYRFSPKAIFNENELKKLSKEEALAWSI